MAYVHSERLTALDASFLELESPCVHMHVGSVGVFSGGPLTDGDGALDFAAVRAVVRRGLRRTPRLIQRLAVIPALGRPVWVDDRDFQLDYHLRHTCLPKPGDERLLKRLAGRIYSQKLDRSRPLWEMWCVEGLSGGRFAVITKVHRALIDGVLGSDLLVRLLAPEPEPPPQEDSAGRWLPRPAPGAAVLLGREVLGAVKLPLEVASAAARAAASPGRSLATLSDAALGIGEVVGASLRPAPATSLNVPIGPHRRLDWTRFDLDVVKEVGARLGGSVNDVVLATVAGALRRLLGARGAAVDDLELRAFVPMTTRSGSDRGGSRVAFLLVALPVDERNPGRRFTRVAQATAALKGSHQVTGAGALEAVADRVAPLLISTLGRLGGRRRSYNLVVANVPGPQLPLYLGGAPLEATYPLVPLFEHQGLGIALFSYDGGIFWGLHADRDAVPDLHDLVGHLQAECETLRKL